MSTSVTPSRFGSEGKSYSTFRNSRSRTNPSDRAGEEIEFASQKALRDTWFTRMRIFTAPYFAEFIGTAVFVLIGCGSNLTYTVMTSNAESAWLGAAFGWGIGLMLGVFVAGGVSGAMLNPAVALSFAGYRGLPWIQVPFYFFAEFAGAFVGALLAYACFAHSLDPFDGYHRQISGTFGSAGSFGNFARPFIGNGAAFLSEAVGTGLLVIGVFAITDASNFPARSCTPIAIGLLLTGLALSIGYPTGYSFNPARDLGPRCAAAIWYGAGVFTAHGSYTWVPVAAPLAGGIVGATLYELFIVSRRAAVVEEDDHSSSVSVHSSETFE
ncbi:glycerol channel [Coemansia sp. RSA 1813]|nr:glycerol channel [Coemansia sp. RSA 1646]KAJ1771343.1 glycerol channel [Coemansia sp. RSA 1843]KAJ2093117.1 glycerol channel [Coemansia sp. RSA 986]KAJ2217619.1 glycerol channel [Coemansia sp. RSA 487]KAJ2573369.1 glycerol channel [Coemansia sp. RSA 1813]